MSIGLKFIRREIKFENQESNPVAMNIGGLGTETFYARAETEFLCFIRISS